MWETSKANNDDGIFSNIYRLTRKGSLYLWDLFHRTCLLHDSLASLVASSPNSSAEDAGTIKIISAKLSKSGCPLVALATRHAFLFDMSLKCSLRVVDDCFPASNFASSWSLIFYIAFGHFWSLI